MVRSLKLKYFIIGLIGILVIILSGVVYYINFKLDKIEKVEVNKKI